ncbi:MAG: hypothetical protein HY726_14445 [Candidatus Rokubacteria bacterium]|nr:hypothetical protein [Candidatus Rokubacteria bacterium]
MTSPFGTSLRRDPDDPRGLLGRIDAQVRERLEEAVDAVCLDLMVQLRRKHRRPMPEADNAEDRREFARLVQEFLVYLRQAYWTGLPETERGTVTQAEAGSEEARRLVGAQVALAKLLPDYWQRFEGFSAAFAEGRLAAPPSRPGLLSRLFGR